MIPPYGHSVSLVMPLDLNEDQNHDLFSPNHHSSSSFSSLSSSYPIPFNTPNQDHESGSHHLEPTRHLTSDHEEVEKIIPSSRPWDHDLITESEQKVTILKKEKRNENVETADEDVKWMSSKMRIMKKMMVVSDQTDGYSTENNTTHKFEDEKQILSPLRTDNTSSKNNNYSNNNTIRVCADCHTTKTPLWRSGPRGPKSLCNACGIRQRKARRAMAAAAALGNGTVVVEAEKSVKGKKLQKKEKKTRIEGASSQIKKKRNKLGVKPTQSRSKFDFEDLTIRLRKNLAMYQVFPQDEKEAAILLMALSYGLVHG